MTGAERRKSILQYLAKADKPTPGTILAREFGVSRQIIVQDIALLRSAREKIISTNRGYLFYPDRRNTSVRVFKCYHTDIQTEDELNCIVDQGGTIDNVYVNHKIYGRIKAEMDIRSRRDVGKFMQGIYSGKSTLLKKITADYHYHTVSAENEEILDAIQEELTKRGYYVPKEQPTLAENLKRLEKRHAKRGHNKHRDSHRE